jgi:FixJ family two-component response regulator
MTAPVSPRSVKLVVVDDDRDVRNSFVELFSSIGWEVTAYENGHDFLQGVLDEVPHCVILDLRLPDMSGLDVQAELAARKISVPLIFVSGSARPQEVRKALAQGAVAVLDKPVEAQLLLERVREAIFPAT